MIRSFDPARTRLRATIQTLEREIDACEEHLSKQAGGDKSSASGLRACVADLVLQLALGAEPEVRECPNCNALAMRAATRCGSCWTSLTPPTETVE